MAGTLKDINLEDDLQTLKEDIAKIRTDISGIAGKAIDKGKKEAEAMKDNLWENGAKTYDNVEKNLAKHPMMTLLGALGIGVMLGYFTNKKHIHMDK